MRGKDMVNQIEVLVIRNRWNTGKKTIGLQNLDARQILKVASTITEKNLVKQFKQLLYGFSKFYNYTEKYFVLEQ